MAMTVGATPTYNNIKHLQLTIAQQKKQQQQIQSSFQTADEQVNQLNHSLHKTNKKLAQQQTSLQNLSQQKRTLTKQLRQQKRLLHQTINNAYRMKNSSVIKLIVNQKDPQTLNRILHYYGYANKTQMAAIQALQQTLAHLESTEHQMIVYKSALQNSLATQRKQQQQLQHSRNKRRTMLKVLAQSIESKQQTLQKVQKDKHELDTIVNKLKNKQTQPSPAFTLHSLPWPAKGSVSQHFGIRVQQSELKTHGIVIDGHEGEPVYATAKGKVVFAKWMSGFGLLIIIQHQNNFMTLYGRNDSLEVEVNDTVNAGDQIASIGHSGGFRQAGLYFALRQGDKPIDPEKMLIKTG